MITTEDKDFEFLNKEPNHFIIPFFPKRRTNEYNEDTRNQFVTQIQGDLKYLSAKLSRLSNRTHPHHEAYCNACESIIGFAIFNIPSQNGQQPGIYINDQNTISIKQMGDGIPHIVGLLADLCIAKNKLLNTTHLEDLSK